MSMAITQAAKSGNRILAGLPHSKYPSLFSKLKPVSLCAHQVLYGVDDEVRYVYFINNGLASLISTTAEGESIEVANVGTEGMVGTPVLLRQTKMPYRTVNQVPGDAFAVSADILRSEFEKEGKLKDRLLSYTYTLETYISQLGVCNHFHTVDKRLCRWLLISSYQAQSESFQLTHESLSQVLGTSRTGVTMAANRLQRAGLIQYHRGRIRILDRTGMEARSCDCYKITKDLFDSLRSIGQ